jgi:phenylacetate-CoA ligase
MGGLTDHLGLESTGALVVPYGSGGSELLIRTILDVGINAISCTPSYPARLEQVIAERFPELTPRELGLRKGFMGGEAGLDDPTFRQRLETVWGMQAMNANYGVSDFLCNFAGQCTDQTDLHFLALDVALPELVDVNTSEPQPWRTGTEGELVLTNLSKDCQSLVRFRTGDLVRLTNTDKCQCGRTAPRFRVIGRTDEMIVVRGVNTYPSSVSAAVLSCPELNGEYRIRLTHKGPYDRLPLEVELKSSAYPSDNLLARLSRHIGRVLRLTVELELLAPGNLPRTEGKTKRVIKEYLS